MANTVFTTDLGTSFRIEPKVHYTGSTQFTWKKDGGALPRDAYVQEHVLFVPKVMPEHEGTYELLMTTQYGNASLLVNLIIKHSPFAVTNPKDELKTTTKKKTPPTTTRVSHGRIFVRQDQDVEMVVGDTLSVICMLRARNRKHLSTTSWYRGDRKQPESIAYNVRPQQDVLKILSVRRQDAGKYTCTLSESDNSRQTLVINLIVREPDTLAHTTLAATSTIPTTTTSTTTTTPTTATKLTLAPTSPVATEPTLSDRNESDEEQTKGGEGLTVSVSPADKVQLVQGKQGYLTCSTNRDDVRIQWVKIGGKLDARRHVLLDGGRTLFIPKVEMDDRGHYDCQAAVIGNDGETSEGNYVTVEVEPREAPVIELYPSASHIQLDKFDSKYVQCRVLAGMPEPRVRWSRVANVNVRGRFTAHTALPSSVTVEHDGTLLAIRQADESVTGTYECVAENVEGSVSQRVEIVVNTPSDGENDDVDQSPSTVNFQ